MAGRPPTLHQLLSLDVDQATQPRAFSLKPGEAALHHLAAHTSLVRPARSLRRGQPLHAGPTSEIKPRAGLLDPFQGSHTLGGWQASTNFYFQKEHGRDGAGRSQPGNRGADELLQASACCC